MSAAVPQAARPLAGRLRPSSTTGAFAEFLSAGWTEDEARNVDVRQQFAAPAVSAIRSMRAASTADLGAARALA